MKMNDPLIEAMKPILVPDDWSPQRDLADFHERCDCHAEPGNELPVAVENLLFHHDNLVGFLNATLADLLPSDDVRLPAAQQMSLVERARLASELAAHNAGAMQADLPRALRVTRFAADASAQLLARLAAASQPAVTLYEVAETADWCGRAANELDVCSMNWPAAPQSMAA